MNAIVEPLNVVDPLNPARGTLRVLAALLCYPGTEQRAHLDAMHAIVQAESALPPAQLAALTAFIDSLRAEDPYQAESRYVEIFDRGRATSLHLFEHVHGDSRDRGPAMVDLALTYEQAGLHLAEGELPDFLPVVLEFASTQPSAQSQAFLGEIAHLLAAIHAGLQRRESAYAAVTAALLTLAGAETVTAKAAQDEPLDESWAEPPVFQGCSVQGQARPGQAQPIHFISARDAAVASRGSTGAAR